MAEKRKRGRPWKLSSKIVEVCEAYIAGGWQEQDDVIPSVASLTLYVRANGHKVTREQLYEWAALDTPLGNDLTDILQELKIMQERELSRNGLRGKFNSTITKLILGKHGYHDKVDNEHSNPDGSMQPQPTRITIAGADQLHDRPTGWDPDPSYAQQAAMDDGNDLDDPEEPQH